MPKSRLVKGVHFGAKNEKVREIQQMLIDMGFDLGKGQADGIYGNDTLNAVRAFQKSIKAAPHGGVDTVTLQRIKVAWLQKNMKDLGHYNGPINGRYTRETRQAIQAFELSLGIMPKGEITDEIIQKIRAERRKRKKMLASVITRTEAMPSDITAKAAKKITTEKPKEKPVKAVTKQRAKTGKGGAKAHAKAGARKANKKKEKAPTYTVSPDTTEYFASLDHNKGELIIDAVLEAAEYTGVPPELMLSLVIENHMSVTQDLNRQLWWLKNRDVNLWKPGPAGETGPTQMTMGAIKAIEKDMPKNIRDGPKDWRYYMYATGLFIKYICKHNLIALDSLTPESAKKIFYHWNAGPFAKGKTNRFAERAFEVYDIIKNKELTNRTKEHVKKMHKKK